MPRTRITDTQRAQVLSLARAGMARNRIAAATGVSTGSVTKICQQAGVAFDRAATASATAARKIDCAAARTALSIKLLARADELLEDMNATYLAYNFGGKENTYNEHLMDAPSPGDKRSLMQAATYAIRVHLDIEDHDGDGGVPAGKSLLARIAGQLGVRGPLDT